MRKYLIIYILCFFSMLKLSAQNTHNLTLEEAMEYAIENNANVQEAALNIEKAESQVWEATSSGLPQISGNVDYNYYLEQPVTIIPDFITPVAINANRDLGLITDAEADQALIDLVGAPQAAIFGTQQNATVGANLSQLLFSGSYLVGLQSAKAFKEITILQKEKTEAVLKEQVANAYSAVLIADETVKIFENNLRVSNKNLSDTEEIYNQGLTEEQNVDQLRYTNKSLESNLNIAKRQRQASLNTLKFVLGIPQEDNLTLVTDVNDIITQSLIDTSGSEIENHIDLRLAENNVTINELRVKHQKSMALPVLSANLNSSYNAFSDEFDFFDRKWYNTTLIGAKLEIPIFSSFGRKSRTQQAKIDLGVAELRLRDTEQELKTNVNNADIEYQNAIENYETAKELVALSDKIYGKEQIKYFEGLSTSLDLNNAETQLYDSQNQYIQSIFQVIQTRNALLQALGKY